MNKFVLLVLLLCASHLFSRNYNFTLRSQFSFPNENDVAGRQISFGQIDAEAAVLELMPDVANGVYFFHVQQDDGLGKTIKVVKF
jgi:hypothetical protein